MSHTNEFTDAVLTVAEEVRRARRNAAKARPQAPFMQEELTHSEYARRFFNMSAEQQLAEMQRLGPKLETILKARP